MERIYIPKLAEEEAKHIVLRALFDAKKGQLSSREVKALAPQYRKMGDDDMRSSDTRSGAPMFHQIVQNAFDRMDRNSGIYRFSYATEISHPLGRVLKITNEGRDFVRGFSSFIEYVEKRGFDAFDFFDHSAIDFTWPKIERDLRKAGFKRGKEYFISCLQSQRYALLNSPSWEQRGSFVSVAFRLSEQLEAAQKAGQIENHTCRPRSIEMWLQTRDVIDDYFDFSSI